MSARLTWIGWDEFEATLKHLPQTLTDAAHAIIQSAADQTASAVRDEYPVKSGLMVRDVTTEALPASGEAVYAVLVRSTAPHAHLWESGTKVRQNRKGANRGQVMAHLSQGVVATADRFGPEMQQELAALVRQYGFELYGSF